LLPESASVLHSWCVQAEWRAPTVVGGAGAWFWDDSGHRYLDMSSLAECMNLGHQHPKLIQAIQLQAQTLCYVNSSWGAKPRAELAERLLARSGFEGGRVFFTLGGADANEHAVKFARQASGRPNGKVVTRDRSYHGASYATMAMSGDSRTQARGEPVVEPSGESSGKPFGAASGKPSGKPFGKRIGKPFGEACGMPSGADFAMPPGNASGIPSGESFGVLRVPPPYAYRCPFGSDDPSECAARSVGHIGEVIARAGTQQVAAVLMEPNAGTNGIIAPPEYWPRLRAETRRLDVYLIADEVMSGFGRCGEWFAWAAYGEAGRPDIMTLAKGLTGAHIPLGAVVLAAHVAAKLEHRMLSTGLTYCGHPLACAAGVAALTAYEEEGLIERSRSLGRVMFERLERLQRAHAVIGDVRWGGGLFAIVELVKDRRSREPLAVWPGVHPSMNLLLGRARERGVSFAIRGNLIILAPPLVILENDLGFALDTLDCLLGELDWS
jgi:taurine--2-oxoglutarate transaminase